MWVRGNYASFTETQENPQGILTKKNNYGAGTWGTRKFKDAQVLDIIKVDMEKWN